MNAYETPALMATFLLKQFTTRKRLNDYLVMAKQAHGNAQDARMVKFWEDVQTEVDRVPEATG